MPKLFIDELLWKTTTGRIMIFNTTTKISTRASDRPLPQVPPLPPSADANTSGQPDNMEGTAPISTAVAPDPIETDAMTGPPTETLVEALGHSAEASIDDRIYWTTSQMVEVETLCVEIVKNYNRIAEVIRGIHLQRMPATGTPSMFGT